MRDIKIHLIDRLINRTKLQQKQEDTRKQKQIDDELQNNRPTDQDSNNKESDGIREEDVEKIMEIE